MNLTQLFKDNPDKLSADVLTTVLYKFLGTDSGMLIRRRIAAINGDEAILNVLKLHDAKVRRRQSFKHNSVVNEEQMV